MTVLTFRVLGQSRTERSKINGSGAGEAGKLPTVGT